MRPLPASARRLPRLLMTALVGALVALGVAPVAGAQGEIDRAREEAEAATERVIAAEARVDATQQRVDEAIALAEEANGVAIDLALDITALEDRVDRANAELDGLRGAVADLAIERYVQGDRFGGLAPPDFDDPYARARAEALGRLVLFGTEDEIDRFRAARIDLDAAQAELVVRRTEQLGVVAELERREQTVIDELDTIQAELAVLAEEEARWEAEVARLEEEERRRLEEIRRRAEEERQRQLAEEQARREAEAALTSTTTSVPPTTAAPDGEAPPETGDAPDGEAPDEAPPETTAPPEPEAPPAGVALCPISGSTSFSDTWGAPRSGGRRHKGVDMFAARGTPIVAHVSGEVRHSNSGLGGLQYFLYGDDGNRYFGSHLDSFGASGRVEAGTVIGTVGNTGNARWTSPHLHFEVHPGGGAAVNPTPYVSAACG
ncbi:MAG: M23 family metallopeptidase [Actinomycetota bacterium]